MPPVDIRQLQPHIVWKHFYTLCTIPRPSKHEQALICYIQRWAIALGLETQRDEIGNLIIRKAASENRHHLPGVILQAHVDMVTQANQNVTHDFFKDAIQPVLKQEWLISENTTLGADNGIGVALALAVLESNDIEHGPLEVLLTIDEEAGMSGARNLSSELLKGQWLFNIDTEEWGQLYLGCAGSIDLEISQTLNYIAIPPGLHTVQINLSGFIGGHSGVDIHLGRANANIMLAQFLQQHLSECNGHLISFNGGTARNAIPREAFAKIALASENIPLLEQKLLHYQHWWREKLGSVDDNIHFELTPTLAAMQVLEKHQQSLWLNALANCPNGVIQMSKTLPDVVHLSNNLGIVELSETRAKVVVMIRAMQNHDVLQHAEHLQQFFQQFSICSSLTSLVSGWTPNPESAALKCLQAAYQQAFNIQPELKVIHAGLECGIIAQHYPDLQMVSFGPDIRGAHAPGERVNVHSVANCWILLTHALSLVK